jgi:hypothetical protein
MSHFPRKPWGGGVRLPESTDPAAADPLADLLDTLRRPGLDDELAGEERSVALIAAAVRAAGTVDHHGRTSMASRRFRLSLGAAFAGAVLVAMSGLAYAGALPGPAQGAASGVLSKVGVSLPASHNDSATEAGSGAANADDPSGDTADTGDTTGDEPGSTGDTGDTGGSGDEGSSGDHGKGKMISQLAHDTPAPGKGKVISVVASGGKSHAGNPPGQAKQGGDAGASHKPAHPTHPDHPGNGGGNGHAHGGSGHSGS